MFNLRDRLLDILEDYYGGSRNDFQKEEIADFIESQGDLLLEALKTGLEG